MVGMTSAETEFTRPVSNNCLQIETHLALGAFQFEGAFIFCRADYESALGSPAAEPDSQSGGFYNACPNFETHPPAFIISLNRTEPCIIW